MKVAESAGPSMRHPYSSRMKVLGAESADSRWGRKRPPEQREEWAGEGMQGRIMGKGGRGVQERGSGMGALRDVC